MGDSIREGGPLLYGSEKLPDRERDLPVRESGIPEGYTEPEWC